MLISLRSFASSASRGTKQRRQLPGGNCLLRLSSSYDPANTVVSVECRSHDVHGGRVEHGLLTGIVHDPVELERPVYELVVDDAFLGVPTAVNVHRLQT